MATIAVTPVEVRPSLMKYWYAYIGSFLAVWALLMFGFGLFPETLRQWPMSVVMTLGSLVAGSTPMGGGAVSFPFLVFWVHIRPDTARTFALAIQALGMTSAMIFILCRRVRIQGRVLVWTVVGAAAGMLSGTLVVAPLIAANFVKLTFACMWMSFAILTMARNREFCSITGAHRVEGRTAMTTGMLVGLIGGLIASIIGVGVEMTLYTVLVLLFRTDLKIAVPTAVSAMAMTSIMGISIHFAMGDIPHDVGMKFLAAGPIVIFGAPIGTYILSIIPRIKTLYFISILCVLQFAWTLYSLERTAAEWTFVVVAISLASALFYVLYWRGVQRGR